VKGKTVPTFESKQIRAMQLDLEEGQAWEDVIPISMTREQWHAVLAAATMLYQQMLEGIEDASVAAAGGDIIAVLVGPKLVESANELHGATRVMVEAVMPSLWNEIEAARTADVAEASVEV
jgi:hypothetical protein